MSAGQLAIVVFCVAAAGVQLARVRTVWAFLLLFIVLTPKIALAAVPGNTTPLRVDDLVIGVALLWWGWTVMFAKPAAVTADFAPRHPAPASPATLFLLLYWGVSIACTLVGIAALTTTPLTGILHVARMLEYGLLYYLFYTAIHPSDVAKAVEVFRTALLLVVGIWFVQHWTYARGAPPSGWGTLYPTFSATYDFGGYLTLATVMLYALWTIGRIRDPLTSIALATGIWLTVNSDSRASLLALMAVLALDVAIRARWTALVPLAAAAAVAPFLVTSKKMLTLVDAIGALVTTGDPGVITQAFATDPSLALRLRNWRLAIEHWVARPWSGDGLGGYLAYIRQYDMPASPDGWYLRLLADTGVLGFVAFALLMAALLWTLFASAAGQTQPLRRAIVYGAGLGVAAALVSALLVDTFVSFKIMGVFWLIVALGTRVAAEPQAQRA
jgi:O-antigen ligase